MHILALENLCPGNDLLTNEEYIICSHLVALVFSPCFLSCYFEVIFSRKLTNVSHPPLVFNNANVLSWKSQKQLGILLDTKLTFEEHYKTILSKINRTIGLLCKLQSLLSRAALITIYKAFVRPHLN